MKLWRRLRRAIRRWGIRLLIFGALWLCLRQGWIDMPFGDGGRDRNATRDSSPPNDGYGRDDWAHWVDADHDCQDTRQEVLIAESKTPVRYRTPRRCRVRRGRWRCPYTGRLFTNPSDLDVDHLVPLHAAHTAGARTWTRARKRAYANALDEPRHLVAVDASANRQKGDKGPEAWLPSDPSARCDYVRAWVDIKDKWALTYAPSERAAIERITRLCAAGRPPPRP